VVSEQAVDDGERDANTVEGGAVRAAIAEILSATECAVHDVNGRTRSLAPGMDGASAHGRAGRVAGVVEEAGVYDLEAAAHGEDGAAALRREPGGVAIREGDVLHGELRRVLVLAVAAGPVLSLVAGVLVKDAHLAAAAEGHLAAAVDDDLGAGVVEDLRRARE